MKPTSAIGAHATIIAARVLGVTSLLAFGAFLLWGPVQFIDLSLETTGALVFDGALSLAFFFQHSGMVRRSFQKRLAVFVPVQFAGAMYTVSSGVVLLVLILLWQPTALSLVTIGGSGR